GVQPAKPQWLAVRVVPAFRERAKDAKRAVADRRWLDESEQWYSIERPAWIARNTVLDGIEPNDLDDDALIEHVTEVRANAAAGYLDHFRLHGADLLPTAMFLARAGDWGIDPVGAAALLAGSSPAA